MLDKQKNRDRNERGAEPSGLARRAPDARAESGVYDIEAEKAVLGAVLLDNAVWQAASATVKSSDFYHPAHAVVFEAMARIVARGAKSGEPEPIDVLTLSGELREQRRLQAIGGLQYLGELAEATPSIANVLSHAGIVAKLAHCRAMERAAAKVLSAAQSGDADAVDAAVEELRKEQSKAPAKRQSVGLDVAIAGVLERFCGRLQAIADGDPLPPPGLGFGIQSLDVRIPAGVLGGEIVVIAAHTSVGKTAFAMQIAVHLGAGLAADEVILVFSLEMKSESLATRIVASLASTAQIANGADGWRTVDVPQQAILTGYVTEDQWQAMAAVMDRADLSVFSRVQVVDDFGLTPEGVVRAIKSARARGKRVKAVFVDYLQRMDLGDDDDSVSIARTMHLFKQTAGDENCAVYILSQFNRLGLGKDGKMRRPVVQDMHGGSAIEKEASYIFMLHRPDTKAAQTELICGKQRSGPQFDVEMVFHGAANRFVDAAQSEPDGVFT